MVHAAHSDIVQNLQQIRERIRRACQSCGRKPEEVRLLLATKTVPAKRIQEAIDAGETLLGENRVQELREKYPLLQGQPVEWHFIGHLQTNKVKDVIKYVTLIHSVDRLKLGQVLHQQLTKTGKTMDILVQVNTSYEPSKFGVPPEQTLALIQQLATFDTLRIRGLMTIGKFSANPNEVRQCFRLLRQIREQVLERRLSGVDMSILSMGMSGDLEVAIEEGATLVRVGTAIFGKRKYPDSYYWKEHSCSQRKMWFEQK